MPTLLVTRKMNPALASRVEAAVTGRRRQGTATHASARLMRRVRSVVLLGLAVLIATIFLALRREHAVLERAREDLVSRWAAEAASVTGTDLDFLKRVETKLVELGNQYSGDLVAEELKTAGALPALLAKPAVYIRGPLAAFAGSNAVAKAARESGKDTLLLCLVDPPGARDEKTLLEKARLGLLGGPKMHAATSSILRLYDAEAGLPYLLPTFAERIRGAKDDLQLTELSREFNAAPISLGKRVIRSELLIAVFDEPNDKATITELDGEAPHTVRLAILRLDKMTPLLRLRKHVDPSWITANRRPQYARELDGCRLAVDVRDTLSPVTR